MQFLFCYVSLVNVCSITFRKQSMSVWFIQLLFRHARASGAYCTPEKPGRVSQVRKSQGSSQSMLQRGEGRDSKLALLELNEVLETQPTAQRRVICSVKKQDKWLPHTEHRAAAARISFGSSAARWKLGVPSPAWSITRHPPCAAENQNLLYTSDFFLLKRPPLSIDTFTLRVGYYAD